MNKHEDFHFIPEWENFELSSINREPAHTRWGAYENENQAVKCKHSSSKFMKSLNGTWKFKLYKNPSASVIDEFFKIDYNDKNFCDIPVPGNWELFGHDKPIYTNYIYPWDLQKNECYAINANKDKRIPNYPYVPADNPTGCYRFHFELPEHFFDRETFLRFEGVETVYYLWINGKPVGYSQDSKLPSEFNISPFVKTERNLIAVQVIRFADSTYLEDQDYWYLSGIFRNVSLISKPALRITDYKITALPILAPAVPSVHETTVDEAVYSHTQAIPTAGDAVFSIDATISRYALYAECKVKVSLYDMDKKIAEGTSDVEAEAQYCIDKKPSANNSRVSFNLKNITQWSPANPKLYTVVIVLINPEGKEIDFESCKTGFKLLEIKDGVLYLNGIRLIVQGVNRHDHAFKYGRSVPIQHMREEIRQMKLMNINAVRTCHYPDSPDWYDLCDEFGILLVSETNLETHGVSGALSHIPYHAKEYVERAMRMVVNFKNHVSVFSWSLGNESGSGANHAAMYGFIKEYDKTRLCQYEAGSPKKNISDIRGNMYAPVEYILKMLCDTKDTRPVILVEYLYQIMNSGGGLEHFVRLTSQFPRFQGGFVWDWQDKCLPQQTKEGKEFFAYGGDFDESFIENTNPLFMCCNGVVLPNLKWKPVAYELKQAYCPLRIEKPNKYYCAYGKIPENEFVVKRLTWLTGNEKEEALDCFTVISEDGIIISEKIFKLPSLIIGGEQNFTFVPSIKKKPGKEYTLNFSLRHRNNTFYAARGNEVGAYQFMLEKTEGMETVKVKKPPKKSVLAEINEDSETISLKIPDKKNDNDINVIINIKTGLIREVKKGKKIYIDLGFKPTLKRPFTGLDCIENWGWRQEYDRVRNLEYNIVSHKIFREINNAGKLKKNSFRVEFEFVMGDENNLSINGTLAYILNAAGTLNVDYKINIDRTLCAIPRIGLELVIPAEFINIQYYGYGPIENYPDRMLCAILAVHDSAVEAEHFQFVPPCENGGHEGTRWALFTTKDNRGIKIKSQTPFHFDAHYNSPDDYINASLDHQLVRRDKAYIHIDAAHGPIGSDMAWSSAMPNNYSLGGGSYSQFLTIEFL